MAEPTQVTRPWRATARTVFQFILAAVVLLPFVVQASGLDPEVYPWLGVLLAVTAGLTRVMALPQVDVFLTRFFPWLAADPDRPGARRAEGGHADVPLFVGIACLVLLVIVIVKVL